MPDDYLHQCLTRQALVSAGITDAAELFRSYCVYPDYFFGDRHAEVAPYMFFCDGIQFHYPPHTPVEEFYRYWNRDEKGSYLVHTRENGNLRHAEAGFSYYIEKTVSLLKEGSREEAWKYLGCLLHFLEDSTFGIHTLEGPDGTDIFVLDRLSGREITKDLCRIPFSEELASLTVEPQVFADNVNEAIPLLYTRYVERTCSSREALFDMAANLLYGCSRRSLQENEKIMFLNALALAADTVATVAAIADGTAPVCRERRLNEFSPFRYPIGGGGGFALRRYDEQENIFTFGVNSEAELLFHIPHGEYRRFSARIRLEDASAVTLQVINDGTCVKELRFSGNPEEQLLMDDPGGVFGFKLYSEDRCGRICICGGTFEK